MSAQVFPRNARFYEGFLSKIKEDAIRDARQRGGMSANNKQESVRYYYKVDKNDDYYDPMNPSYIIGEPVEHPCGKYGGQHNWINDDEVVGVMRCPAGSQTCSLCNCTKISSTRYYDDFNDANDYILYALGNG
jgi:hypothetical protein